MTTTNVKAVLALVCTFLIWGTSPLYFKLLSHVNPLEILGHRIFWSFIFLLIVLVFMNKIGELKTMLFTTSKLKSLVASTLLITCNWFLFIWAILNKQIIESSLGYFITPLFNVMLGILFFKERLRFWQKISLLLAILAIAIQIFIVGYVPLLSLGIATSFSIYGLVRKKAKIDPLLGLTGETFLLFPLICFYFLYLYLQGNFQFLLVNLETTLLLASAGVITAIPLVMYVVGANQLPLSVVGLLQYISPTIQFLIATLIYHEPMHSGKLLSFIIIWIALILFILDSFFKNGFLLRLKSGSLPQLHER